MAFEEEAPRVEGALKTDVSIPAEERIAFNHLAIVDGTTGVWGLDIDKNSWLGFKPSSVLHRNVAVLARYCCRQATGQRIGFSNLEKDISPGKCVGLLCFASPMGRKTILEGKHFMWLTERRLKSELLLAEQRANNIGFHESFWRVKESLGPQEWM